jgi:hypothetical protein
MISTGECVVYPHDDPAEGIETVQVVAEDPTGGVSPSVTVRRAGGVSGYTTVVWLGPAHHWPPV